VRTAPKAAKSTRIKAVKILDTTRNAPVLCGDFIFGSLFSTKLL
jgi:hypothetical protein